MASVVLEGPVLEHFIEHSQLIRSLMENPNVPDRIELTADVLPNGEIDVAFLQDWIDGEKIGELNETTGEFVIRPPFDAGQAITLLDHLMYDHPKTLTAAFFRSPVMGRPGNIVLKHGNKKPVATPPPPTVKNYGNALANNNFNNNFNNFNLPNKKAKRNHGRPAYADPNQNNNNNTVTPWAKRKGTKKAKGKWRKNASRKNASRKNASRKNASRKMRTRR